MKNPEAYGAPSFDQFVKNREKWIGRDDELMGLVDGGQSLIPGVKTQKYYFVPIVGGVNGKPVPCKALVDVERMAKDCGATLRELDIQPNIENDGAGTYTLHIHFYIKRRG
jgi:hypothetical protein